jgi:hypothetical protein
MSEQSDLSLGLDLGLNFFTQKGEGNEADY